MGCWPHFPSYSWFEDDAFEAEPATAVGSVSLPFERHFARIILGARP